MHTHTKLTYRGAVDLRQGGPPLLAFASTTINENTTLSTLLVLADTLTVNSSTLIFSVVRHGSLMSRAL
jgi:hypothetical protein